MWVVLVVVLDDIMFQMLCVWSSIHELNGWMHMRAYLILVVQI